MFYVGVIGTITGPFISGFGAGMSLTGFGVTVGSGGVLALPGGATIATGEAIVTIGAGVTLAGAFILSNSSKLDDVKIPSRMEKRGNNDTTKMSQKNQRNDIQNRQFKDAIKEIQQKTGRKFTKDDKREFHEYITKQGYDYHEIIEEGVFLFGKH